MLINHNFANVDPIFELIASIGTRFTGQRCLDTGVYEIGHFGGSHFMRGFNEYPDLGEFNAYGVCDDHKQILEQCPAISDPARQFVITVTKITKADEPSDGGWRWHKWGPYIGTHEPQCEYIHDEPVVEQVYCYHIYEKQD